MWPKHKRNVSAQLSEQAFTISCICFIPMCYALLEWVLCRIPAIHTILYNIMNDMWKVISAYWFNKYL